MNLSNSLRLWYKKPALSWEQEALPIGNAYMGAMIFGGVHEDKIQYNEKTLWSGGPGIGESYTYGNRKDAYKNLESVRELLINGNNAEAKVQAHSGLNGLSEGFGSFQSFGEIILVSEKFKNKNIENYTRELDLEDAISRVKFTCEGVNYEREYFCSYPDRVMVIKLKASEKASISVDIKTVCNHENHNVKIDNDSILVRGNVSDNNMIFESQIKVISKNGNVSNLDDRIVVRNSDTVTIILSAGTDYVNEYPLYKGEDPHKVVSELIDKAIKKSYVELMNTHTKDYKNLFDRVRIELNSESNMNCEQLDIKTTDELIECYNPLDGRSLEMLQYNYGRYLLISSSREGTLPANLQGVWNDSNTPAWCGDYHFNINIQMNYWGTESANLSECSNPLVDYIESLLAPGRVTAKEFFGVTDGGWAVNTMNNPFGYTAVGWSFGWGWAPNSNAFICQNLWEKYQFSRDKEYLKTRIYPIIREAAEFWTKFLIEDVDGTLVSSPSISPEQGNIEIGVAMDQQLVSELFSNTIEASTILGIDEEFREKLIEQRKRLSAPLRIGSWGQIQEWKTDMDDPNDKHRHISHMAALYPCKQINRSTPEFMEAARKSVEARGDESTGWSLAWKMNMWARLCDGNRAHKLMQMFLRQVKTSKMNYEQGGGIYSNLLCAHPPFQIDGNCGYVAGVSEMLIQSHNSEIQLLPAMPSVWKAGKVKGLIARGAFEIGMEWKENKVQRVTLKSLLGNDCKIVCDGLSYGKYKIYETNSDKAVDYKYEDGAVVFETGKNKSYCLELEKNMLT